MGANFQLANRTKREVLHFGEVGATKASEITGCAVTSAIVTWYLLTNRGDEIAFVSDEEDGWPFTTGSVDEVATYTDVTNQVVAQLIAKGILSDEGYLPVLHGDPSLRVHVLKNIWNGTVE